MDNHLKMQIITGASDAFARYGVKGTTMQFLAESLHVSKRTLYVYFPDKNILLAECVRQACMANLRAIRTRTASADGLEALWCTADSAYKLLTRPAPAFRIEFARVRSIRTLLDECYWSPLMQLVERLILRARAQGLISPKVDPQQLFTLFEGLLVAAAREVSPAWSRREFFDSVFGLCLAGICTEQGRKRLNERIYQKTDAI